jgi:predicted DNA-binding transcriptional regulator YafY
MSGEESEREPSPFGLVVHSGCWYIVAHDHKRDDLRTFRVDRMWRTTLAAGAFASPPDRFDAVAHLTRSLAGVPWQWQVEVLLELPVDEAMRRVSMTLRPSGRRGGRLWPWTPSSRSSPGGR